LWKPIRMARDLGTPAGEVHRAAEILRFWLGEITPEKRFAQDPAIDQACRQRFGDLRETVFANAAAGWRGTIEHLLAAIILLDQFSRNLFREDARAFEADPLTRALTREALARGWDRGLDRVSRQFLYMPLMHSEHMADQVSALRLFAALGDADSLDFARKHAAQIAQFGRFPQRNEVLGRATTPAEAAFLSRPGARF
jgi:uncharacterized protein (DUF924 family)